MAVVVATGSRRPLVVVLQLNGQNRFREMPGPEVQLLDPLLDGERTEDQATGALDIESVVGGILWTDGMSLRSRLACNSIEQCASPCLTHIASFKHLIEMRLGSKLGVYANETNLVNGPCLIGT